mgnify:FL=1
MVASLKDGNTKREKMPLANLFMIILPTKTVNIIM